MAVNDEKAALTALHVASRPENMSILSVLGVDGQASFLDLRSGSGLSNEGLRRRLEDLQRYHMIQGEVSPSARGVRVVYVLTDLGDRFRRLLLDSLDQVRGVDTRLSSGRFVLGAEALQEIVRVAGASGTKQIFKHSKIMLRKSDHDKLRQGTLYKEGNDMETLLRDPGVVSIVPAPPGDEMLARVGQHLRKSKKLNADDSEIILVAMSHGASLITDDANLRSAARSMGVVSAGSTDVSNMRGTKPLQDVFYEMSIAGDTRRRDHAADDSKRRILQGLKLAGTEPPAALPHRKAPAFSPFVNPGADHGGGLGSMSASQEDSMGNWFRSEKEHTVHRRLAERKAILGDKFLGALMALRQEPVMCTRVLGGEDNYGVWRVPNPDKISQSAHSIREMLNLLLRGEEPGQAKEPSEIRCQSCGYMQVISDQKRETPGSNRERMKMAFDPLNNRPDHFEGIYDELHELHRWFVKISHSVSVTPEKYDENLMRFIHVMHLLLSPHFNSATRIDDIAKMKNPKDRDLREAEAMMRTNTILYRSFFAHAGAEWLDILAKDGNYFKYAPGEAMGNGPSSYAALPEFGYLERAAPSKPLETLNVIKSIKIPKNPFEQNPWAIRHLARAGAAMPPKHAREVAQKAIREGWHRAKPFYQITSLAELVLRVSETDIKTSLDLCSRLLDLTAEDTEGIKWTAALMRYRQIRGLLDDHSYEQIIKESVPRLADTDNDAVLEAMCDKLKESIDMENRFLLVKQPKQHDLSNTWRPAVEDHEQNGRGVQSLMVKCIRELLERSEKSGIGALRASLRIVSSYKYHIFRRIEVYIYARNPEHFSGEINRLAIEYFDNYHFKHEYYHMLKTCYGYLTDRNKKLLLARMSRGPVRRKYPVSDDEFEVYKKHWRIAKLDPIIEYLPEHKGEYNSLVKKYGRSTLIEFNRYIHTPKYEVDDFPQVLGELSPKRMIEFLRSYPMRDNPEGLRAVKFRLRDSVRRNPAKYSKLASAMLACAEEFHCDFLEGFAEKHDSGIDWGPVLAFCTDVVMPQDGHTPERLEEAIRACANVLRFNLTNDRNGISYSMRKKVWRILEYCAKAIPHGEMVRDVYVRDDGPAHHPMTISINNATGVTAHAIVQYAAWDHNNAAKDASCSPRLRPEVRSVLGLLLGADHPRPVSVHAALGYGFAALFYSDKKWATDNVGAVFTRDAQHVDMGDAAWDAYLANVIYEDVFHLLRPEYEYRIKCLPKDGSGTESQKRLVEHVAVAYLHGMRISTKILEVLISHASADSVGKCLETMGQGILSKTAEKERPDIKIYDLLKYKKVRSNPGAGWLFVCRMADKDDSIRALSEILENTNGAISPIWWVVEELKQYAGSHPSETILCIQRIIRKYKNSDDLLLIIQYLDEVLELVLATNNEQAVRVVKEVADLLGRIGLEQFRRFAWR